MHILQHCMATAHAQFCLRPDSCIFSIDMAHFKWFNMYYLLKPNKQTLPPNLRPVFMYKCKWGVYFVLKIDLYGRAAINFAVTKSNELRSL